MGLIINIMRTIVVKKLYISIISYFKRKSETKSPFYIQELETGQTIDNIAWNYLKYLWKSACNINNYNQAYLPHENPWEKHTK